MEPTTAVTLVPIDPAELEVVRRTGRDLHGHDAEPFTEAEGGSQLRCCLARSRAGEALLLVSHAPLGPIGRGARWVPCSSTRTRARRRTIRTPSRPGSTRRRASCGPTARTGRCGTRRTGSSRRGRASEAALGEVLADPDVSEVHVRNLLAQCFITRAVRSADAP